jgi:hypothetical protein
MLIVSRVWWLIPGVTLLLLGSGCKQGKPALVRVRGTVSYQRKPLSCGTIVFTPDPSRGHGGELARGEIKANGTYRLKTGGRYGVAPGWYQITVLAVDVPDHPRPGERYVVPRPLLPERYCDPELADLIREVVPDRENQIDLHLE